MQVYTLLALCLLLLSAANALPGGRHGRFRVRAQFGAYLDHTLPRNRYLRGARGKRLMQRVEPLMQKIIHKGGCNANVCFALDGSWYVTDAEYAMQKEFVELATVLVGVSKDAHFAATFLERPRRGGISALTSDQDAFLVRVAGSSRSGGLPRLGGGIRFCSRQMRPRREDANKIVLIGDGRNHKLYRERATRPLFRFMSPRRRGQVCAVGVGNVDRSVLQYLTGSPDRVLAVDGYIELSEIVEKLVAQLCGLK